MPAAADVVVANAARGLSLLERKRKRLREAPHSSHAAQRAALGELVATSG